MLLAGKSEISICFIPGGVVISIGMEQRFRDRKYDLKSDSLSSICVYPVIMYRIAGSVQNLFFFTLFLLFSIPSLAQDDWDVPWQVIGDSADLVPKQNIIVTGKITQKGTSEAISGASISAETFKYFDYSDQAGRYTLELPPGRYRIMVRYVGMKTRYLRLSVLSAGLFNIEMEEGTTGLQEVVISSRPIDSNVKQALAGLTKLNVREIKTLPTPVF